jgi:hypothetical protein
MRTTNLIIETALLLSVVGTASGQAAPNVNQTATRSNCSNIVALSGAKVDCSHLTPEQSKALANIPAILKMAIENQSYLEAIKAKMDEMSAQQTTTVVNANAPHGIAIGGNNYGNPVVNNYGPPKYSMTDAQADIITNAMRSYSGSSIEIQCIGNHQDVLDYCVKLHNALESAGVTATVQGGMMTDVGPGLFVSYTDTTYQAINALALAMRQAQLINGPIKGDKAPERVPNPNNPNPTPNPAMIWVTPLE